MKEKWKIFQILSIYNIKNKIILILMIFLYNNSSNKIINFKLSDNSVLPDFSFFLIIFFLIYNNNIKSIIF